MKIIIDPRSSYAYGSFYIEGLRAMYGARCIVYDTKPFKDLPDMGNDMRFIMVEDKNQLKYFLHLNDSYKINDVNYHWCDVYGSVNANYSHYPKSQYPKLVSLAPSFGVRVDKFAYSVLLSSLIQLPSIWNSVWNAEEWNKHTQRMECNHFLNLKHFFGRRYKSWKNRLPLSSYDNEVDSDDHYVFFLSTLWYNDQWNKNDEGVNLRRAHFIRACKSVQNCQFEGGLLYTGGGYSQGTDIQRYNNRAGGIYDIVA